MNKLRLRYETATAPACLPIAGSNAPDERRVGPTTIPRLFYSRVGTPLTPYNVSRTSRGILRNAALAALNITPQSFCRPGALHSPPSPLLDRACNACGLRDAILIPRR